MGTGRIARMLLVGMVIVLLLLFSCIRPANADDGFHLIQINRLFIDYHSYFMGGRDPLIFEPGMSPGKEIDLHLNTHVLKYGYWDNMVHTMTDQSSTSAGQFRTVGWQMELGLHLSKSLDVYYYHHSQHVLDSHYPYEQFPVLDAVGFRINIIGHDNCDAVLPW